MQRLTFLLAYPLLWIVSRLPFPLLYLLSDGVCFLVYRIFRYRRKVVRDNLELAFPEKPAKERKEIERKFYAHLCDMFLEMVKTFGISREELEKRFTFSNLEVIRSLEAKDRSIMLMAPHYASWEWVFILDLHIKGEGFAIYQPIKNRYFDRWVRRVRKKFGTTLITTKETKEVMWQNKEDGRLAFYGMLSDQSPMPKKARYWREFMGITVPVHTGAENLCKRMDIPAIYMKVRKIKRGYYQAHFELLAEDPASVPDYGITDAFFRQVEQSIREAPEYYFWTHKRWKHRHKAPGQAGTTQQAQKITPGGG